MIEIFVCLFFILIAKMLEGIGNLSSSGGDKEYEEYTKSCYREQFDSLFYGPHLLITGGIARERFSLVNRILAYEANNHPRGVCRFYRINRGSEVLQQLQDVTGCICDLYRQMAENRPETLVVRQQTYVVIDDLEALCSGNNAAEVLEELYRILQMGSRAKVHAIACIKDAKSKRVPEQLIDRFPVWRELPRW